jgi:hypothetical protein
MIGRMRSLALALIISVFAAAASSTTKLAVREGEAGYMGTASPFPRRNSATAGGSRLRIGLGGGEQQLHLRDSPEAVTETMVLEEDGEEEEEQCNAAVVIGDGVDPDRGGKLLRLRGGKLDVSWRPAPLQKTKQWIEATTFDETPVDSRFDTTWSHENMTMESRCTRCST